MSRLQKCLTILIGTAMLVAAKEKVPAKFSGFQVTSQENEKKLEFNNGPKFIDSIFKGSRV